MPYCQHCRETVGEDVEVCPGCGETLISEDENMERADVRLQEEVEEAKDRTNMYLIVAAVLVTVGIVGGSLLLVSSSILGLFGIALVCLSIGCAAAGYRQERKARSLKNQLSQCN